MLSKKQCAQRGNILFWVLIGVALFAALGFAVGSGRDNTRNIQDVEQNRLIAKDIIQYGNSVASAVNKLARLSAAEDTNANSRGIMFAASGANATYGTPGDQPAFEVFNIEGGGLYYIDPPTGACTAACAFEFTPQFIITGLGSDSMNELSMILSGVDPDVCQLINRTLQLGWSSVPTGSTVTLERFDGSNYPDGGMSPATYTMAGSFTGKTAFCYRESGGGQRYTYVHVLRSR